MSWIVRIVCVVVALVCIVGLECYARKGENLTANGKKFLRLVYAFVGGVLIAAAIFG